jgi:hypothetical protein
MDENDKEIVVMYRQMDGYPSVHGQELADFLKKMTLTDDGYTLADVGKSVANGAACLAAQAIMHFKSKVNKHMEKTCPNPGSVGGIYLYPAGTRDAGEEWIYVVSVKDGKTNLRVDVPSFHKGVSGKQVVPQTTVFDGPASKFNAAKVQKAADKHVDDNE